MEKSKKKFKLSGVAIFNIIVGILTVGLLVYFIVSDGGIIDLGRFGELGSRGVLALMADSTNAERPGYTPTERKVGA